MKPDDIILGLNGQPVKDGDDLIGRVADTPVGTQVTLNVDRDGKKMDFKLTIQDRIQVYADEPSVAGNKTPAEEPAKPDTPSATQVKFGFSPRVVSEEERELTPDKHGVTVTRVEPGSFAEEVGMQEHDIIIAINRQPVSSVDDIKKVQSDAEAGRCGGVPRGSLIAHCRSEGQDVTADRHPLFERDTAARLVPRTTPKRRGVFC